MRRCFEHAAIDEGDGPRARVGPAGSVAADESAMLLVGGKD
jgi:hypothetical protein